MGVYIRYVYNLKGHGIPVPAPPGLQGSVASTSEGHRCPSQSQRSSRFLNNGVVSRMKEKATFIPLILQGNCCNNSSMSFQNFLFKYFLLHLTGSLHVPNGIQKHRGTYREILAFWELVFPGGLVIVLTCDCLPNSWRSPKALCAWIAYVPSPVTLGVFTGSSVLVMLPVSVQRSASFSRDCRRHCVGIP